MMMMNVNAEQQPCVDSCRYRTSQSLKVYTHVMSSCSWCLQLKRYNPLARHQGVYILRESYTIYTPLANIFGCKTDSQGQAWSKL
jgi:hypothetical protein